MDLDRHHLLLIRSAADKALKRLAIDEALQSQANKKPETRQDIVLRILKKLGPAKARDIQQRMSKTDRLRCPTPEIKQAMRDLIESDKAMWVDATCKTLVFRDSESHEQLCPEDKQMIADAKSEIYHGDLRYCVSCHNATIDKLDDGTARVTLPVEVTMRKNQFTGQWEVFDESEEP